MRKDSYKTVQKEMIVDFFKSNPNQHLTIKEVERYLNSKQQNVGLTTIYRCVDKLVKENVLKKYIVDNNSSACFAYQNESCHEKEHYHLKCDVCNTLYHLDCEVITSFQQHMLEHHGFEINPHRTVYYGTCKNCQIKENV